MAWGTFGDQCTKLNTGQLTTGAAAQLIAGNGERRSLVVTNTDTTNSVGVGTSASLTTANGQILLPLQSISFQFYIGAIWVVAQAGTPKVTFAEEAKQ